MIEEGEGVTIEFKRKVTSPEKIARTLIAFANSHGGNILFGVDDDGFVCGVRSEKEEVEQIQFAGNFLAEPPVLFKLHIVPYKSKKDVIVCTVFESDTKPHKITDEKYEGDGTGVFIRERDATLEASKEVVKVLQDARPLRLSIGENERRLFAYLEEKRTITVNEFAELINVSRRTASRSLVALVRAGVVRIYTHEKDDYFTLA
jgi:predicted HTH transcriptional regulator